MKRERHLATWFALLVLLLVGFAVRAWGIERYGLWIDEIATSQCLEYDLLTLFDCRRAELGSPLPHVATNVVYTLFGRPPLPAPEWLVRLPELLAGTFAILAAWLAAREVLGARGAWLNAWLWTFAPTAVAYSQEARMYAWLMLFANLSTWLFIRAVRERSWRIGILFGITAALNFYSHYLGVFVIAGQFLFAVCDLARAKYQTPLEVRRLTTSILGAGIVLLVLLAPWLPNIRRATQVHVLSTNYTNAALTPAYFADAQAWLVLNGVELPIAAIILLSLESLGGWWLFQKRRRTLALVGCWLAVTFGFLVWRQAGFTSFRYWIVIQTPMYWLLTAGGLALADFLASILQRRPLRMDQRVPDALIAILGVIALLPWLAQFYSDPFESWRFDDWRGAAQFFRSRAQDNDLVIAFGDASVYHILAMDYYLPRAFRLRVIEPDELNGNIVARARTQAGRAWGIVYARSAQDLETLRARGGAETDVVVFKNLALISPRPRASDETLAVNTQRLVDAARDFDPERFTLANALLTDRGGGENLVKNPEFDTRKTGAPRVWKFGAGRGSVIKVDDQPALQLVSAVDDGSVTAQQQVVLQPARLYMFRFECRNELTRGAQRTYITFNTRDDPLLVFPNGAGDVCPTERGWHESAFAFRAPPADQNAQTATLLLRNAGIGEAEWRNLSLYEVAAP